MDVSLDDYISKSNFKVQIGNPSFKGSQIVKTNPPGGFQTGKKKFGQGFQPGQGNKVADYSITVPSVRKTVTNVNRTNPVRDARERLQPKKPVDARDKLNKKQNVDARQKLMTIRAGKDPVETSRPFDARAKLQAKKQQTGPVQKEPQTGGFALTRTVNNAGAAAAVGSGVPQITRTLTKVMPPGYEDIGTALPPQQSAPKQQKQPSQQQSIKMRLGPQQGTKRPIENLTRTVSNPPRSYPPQHQLSPGPPSVSYSEPRPPPAHVYQHPVQQAPPSEHIIIHSQAPPSDQAPPPGHALPPRHHAPHPPPHHSHAHMTGHYAPPPQQPVYPAPPQSYPTYQYPATDQVIQAPPVQTPHPNPPYPIERRDIVHPVEEGVPNPNSMSMPRIQVHNDQYRPIPPPQHVYPPPPTQSYEPAQAQYSYRSAEPPVQQTVYQSIPQEPPIQRAAPRSAPSSGMFVKTIVNENPSRVQTTSHPSLKRRSAESAGPLRMSSTNTIPVIKNEEDDLAREYKYTKAVIPLQEPATKRVKEQEDESTVISPLQGYRIIITNLHSSVTQEDVIELFGAIGAVRRVRMVKPGISEVVYVKKDDAINAVKSYHERELDGMPMTVKMSTPPTARVKEAAEKLPPSVQPAASAPLKFTKKTEGKKGVDVGVLHKALFKTGTAPTAKPVTFTVNI